jgi:hypothetical protein
MLKLNLSRALRAVRRTALMLGLAMTLALVLGVATVALAAVPGDPFRLGRVNTINALTSLVGSVNNAMLKVDNNSTGTSATALDLQVESGKAPMKVNSQTKVANLNADQLDGKSASELSRIAQGGGSTQTWLPLDETPLPAGKVSITAPAQGFVRINGTVDVGAAFEGAIGTYSVCTERSSDPPGINVSPQCMVEARLRHVNSGDSIQVTEDVQNRVEANFPVNWVFPVSADDNTFDVQVNREFPFSPASPVGDRGTLLASSILTAEYTPYGSTGTDTLGAGPNVQEVGNLQNRLTETAQQQP